MRVSPDVTGFHFSALGHAAYKVQLRTFLSLGPPHPFNYLFRQGPRLSYLQSNKGEYIRMCVAKLICSGWFSV